MISRPVSAAPWRGGVAVLCFALLALARTASGALPSPEPPAALELRVDQALSRAVAHLWRSQQKDHWEEKVPGAAARDFGGRTALCVYALLTAGESYQDARLAACIDWLCHQKMTGVYARSLRVMALSSLPRKPG